MGNVPRQRSEEEVIERVRALGSAKQDFLGFQRFVLYEHLSVEILKELDVALDEPQKWEPRSLHLEPVMAELADYMTFAWGKVADHRGLSANRSVDKITSFVWLLGLDDLLALMEETDYPQYGAPKLAVVCLALNLPVPSDEETQRMILGEPCVPGCGEGCG